MRKVFKLLVFILILSTALFGCVKKEEDQNAFKQSEESINVIVPEGTTSMSLIKLMHDNPEIDGVKINYECIKTTDLLTSKLISEEADIALIPTNLGVKIYNKGLDYKLACSSIWGNLYIVSNEDIKSFSDLKGKEISMIGKGLTPDIIFRYLLSQNGLNPDTDLTISYVGGATELAPAFISGKSKISIMPEPMLSKVLSKKNDAKIVMDLQEEWRKATGFNSSYPQASLFIKGSLIKNNKKLADKFLNEYENSINWVNQNPDSALSYAKDLKLESDDSISNVDIQRFNIRYVDVNDSKKPIQEYLNVLLNYSKDTIGGKLPDEKIYYEGK